MRSDDRLKHPPKDLFRFRSVPKLLAPGMFQVVQDPIVEKIAKFAPAWHLLLDVLLDQVQRRLRHDFADQFTEGPWRSANSIYIRALPEPEARTRQYARSAAG